MDIEPDDAEGWRNMLSFRESELKAAEEKVARLRHSVSACREAWEQAKRYNAKDIPVDRSDRTLTDGSPVTDDHRELKANGQQNDYVVLSEAERAKGFVRPVRRSYKHLKCGGVTTMGQALAETYARDPSFYSGTFCCDCGSHFPVGEEGEFVWADDGSKVGT
jgi:hypothetical protein